MTRRAVAASRVDLDRAPENRRCAAETAPVLDAHGVAPADLAWLGTHAESGGGSLVTGHRAIFALKGYPGYIVIREKNTCFVGGIFADHGAKIPLRLK